MKKVLLSLVFFISIIFFAKAQYKVETYSGSEIPGLTNGNLKTAKFGQPFGMCIDKDDNLFIADQGNNCIRKISFDSIVSTYAGASEAGFLDGNSDVALFNGPASVCVDDSGNIYVADFSNHRIRKINTDGIVSTYAGTGVSGYTDGSSGSAKFSYPRGLCVDKNNNIYVSDSWNHRIRKIDNQGNVTTYAGGGNFGVFTTGDYVDGNDTSARFYTPCGISIDSAGNIYVADAYNHRIRKINLSRQVSTIAGNGPTGSGNGFFLDGEALTSRFNTPTEVFVDKSGNLYISDTFNNRVRKYKVLKDSVITIAGDTAGFNDGYGNSARFNYPRGIVLNQNEDKIFVCDYNNNSIRVIYDTTSSINILKYKIESLNIFPNPSNDVIEIITNESDFDFYIYNAIGNTMVLEKNKKIINISNLPKGSYIAILKTKHKIYQQKIVVY